jgi:N,N'-diacetyllegionaminate synthase
MRHDHQTAVEIIAEVAQGYEGNPKLASMLAIAATRAGADAVKYQLVFADELATPDYKYYELFRTLEMPESVWKDVVRTIREAGKRAYFDIYGTKGLELATALGADGIKLSTTEFFNDDLVRRTLSRFPKIFVAIGGIGMQDLRSFIDRHGIQPSSPVCFLYGVQNSPTMLEDNHLLRLKYLQSQLPGFRFGLMDHTQGDSPDALILPLLALPLGARVIEKHITLDRLLEIEDYVSALTPEHFAAFVQSVRRFEKTLGSEDMEISESERQYKQRTAKVVVATRDIQRGTRIGADDVALKRVGKTLKEEESIHRLEDVLGKQIDQDVKVHEPISLPMVK